MPWALAAAAVTAGAGLLGANAANKAGKDALNAQNQATDKQIAAQEAARAQITQLQQPFINSGYGALSQLAARYGYGAPSQSPTVANPYAAQTSGPQRLPPEGDPSGLQREYAGGGPNPFAPQTRSSPSAPTDVRQSGPTPNPAYVGGVPQTTPGTPGVAAGTPDIQAYLAQNPDVAQRAQQGVASGEIGPSGQWKTPEEWAAYHYQNTGQAEGRQMPTSAGSPGTPETSQLAPADAELSQAIGQRPTFKTPDYGASPDASSYFGADKFHTDPGYEFSLAQRLRGGNASFGARGLLKSSAAIKGLADYAGGMADQQYGNWWNRQNTLLSEDRNQFNTDRSANYNIFSNDRTFANNNYTDNRDYATNRYDTTANNLFRVVGLGTGAAASIGGADTNYANNAAKIYGNQGANAANAAYARGATNSQLYGNLGGAAANYLNLRADTLGGSGYGSTPANWAAAVPSNPFATSYNWGPI
jgi:hypothetical protein